MNGQAHSSSIHSELRSLGYLLGQLLAHSPATLFIRNPLIIDPEHPSLLEMDGTLLLASVGL